MRRKVIIDQDTLGPAGTNLQAIALLLNAPDVEVLAITVPTGDHWRDQQVRHALRRLDAGHYGRCEHCKGPVEPTRLDVLPAATTCSACAAH